MSNESGVFHVLCRDCTFESVRRSRDDAERAVDDHDHAHRATFARVN